MDSVKDLNIVRLNIQLTKKCNQRCKSCNSYNLDCGEDLTLDEIKNVIQDICDKYSIRNIALTGGEPTLHRNILDIAQFAKMYSSNVSITTNGFYCTSEERVKELIDAGINRFSFSYHSVGKHDLFTGVKGSENRLRSAIDFLCKEREKSNIYIKVGTLFDGRNIDGVEKVLEYAETKNIDVYIEVWDNKNDLFKKAELEERFEISEFDKQEIERGLEKIENWNKSGRKILMDKHAVDFMRHWFLRKEPIKGKCPLGYTDIYVENNGNIRSGCWFLSPVGNIKVMSIKNILDGEMYNNIKMQMLRRECRGCTCGYLAQAKYMDYD